MVFNAIQLYCVVSFICENATDLLYVNDKLYLIKWYGVHLVTGRN